MWSWPGCSSSLLLFVGILKALTLMQAPCPTVLGAFAARTLFLAGGALPAHSTAASPADHGPSGCSFVRMLWTTYITCFPHLPEPLGLCSAYTALFLPTPELCCPLLGLTFPGVLKCATCS